MQALVEVFRLYTDYFLALLLSLPRLYAFLSASQLLNSAAVPMMPRTATILSLALIAAPINLDYAMSFDHSAAALALYFAKEYAVGFLAGYVVGWMFWAIQAAGGLIDSQRGAAVASAIDPLQGEETSLLGTLLSQAFLTYVLSTGAFLLVLGVVFKSYAIWPATKAIPIASDLFPGMALGLVDVAMRMAFVTAAPVLAVMFLAEFALAIVSRFSPQVQVFVLAMPIKSVLAILVLVFYAPTLMPFVERQFASFERNVGQMYGLLKLGDRIGPPATATEPAAGGRK
ncbi:EscT/YscT/HrcT family type III secretion system export apparatus protein [Bradyrhizobium sp. CCBAU 53351]|uniref:type III secretion system export apparatus subunit SctT n=1 Tax=Bradyrhizobium sp. CCBAU 53351 TaxID=1325114 RepID=UPI0018878B18|nr:type III secretion system export apparatus subunit SctT [Bradyrhizobium sp. CCBAU 53351]QOZ76313.1 EscT/YscT/HrcT family type III secretion system export apparatus protein [Bradyrhizobium sp. CCBAU 53351]